jgi:MoaA/NifB/PqqE/SkfB family radical SAM enzyme
MIKTREFKDKNYKAIYFEGKTIRIALDDSKDIEELDYPEFYDVSITDKCKGNCPYCYQDSMKKKSHCKDILGKFEDFFGNLTDNEKPFQIAYGGGEPTLHPRFIELLKLTYKHGITPNYTTNGMKISSDLMIATKKYCGGVAVSCHSHLEKRWKHTVKKFIYYDIKVNLHIIISNKKSVDDFLEIYEMYKADVEYFVLLPYMAIGRAKEKYLAFDYLFDCLKKIDDIKDVAFGANFYPYVVEHKWLDISLYQPEILSKYLNFQTMEIYKSSFNLQPIN